MYNIQDSRVASDVRDALAEKMTAAHKTSPADEHEQLQAGGQLLNWLLEDIDDDHLVDVQLYGSNLPSAGTRTFHLSVNVRPIKTPTTKQAPEEQWTPEKGPLSLRSSPSVPGEKK